MWHKLIFIDKAEKPELATIKITIIFSLFSLLCLGACGPKEIGQDAAPEPLDPPCVSSMDNLRLPMSSGASNTQKMLYWINRPDVMQNVQNWQRSQYRRAMGLAPDPEDEAYREIPQQRSPFRQ